MMGDVTDLLNAAAVLAGVPLIALSTTPGSGLNNEAFGNDAELREQLLEEAKGHAFTQTDIANIEAQLDKLFVNSEGSKTAWRHIKETMPRFKGEQAA